MVGLIATVFIILLTGGVATDELRTGDVMIGYGGSTLLGIVSAGFPEAVLAWETRSVFRDESPGAVQSALPAFTVGWDASDIHGDAGTSVEAFVNTSLLRDPPVHAQLGMMASQAVGQLAHRTGAVVMGYASWDMKLSDKSLYKYFLRTCHSVALDANSLIILIRHLSVTNLLLLYQDHPDHVAFYQHVQDHKDTQLQLQGERLAYQWDPATANMTLWRPTFERIVMRRERYFATPCTTFDAIFFALAREVGLFSSDRQWFGITFFSNDATWDYTPYIGMMGVRGALRGAATQAWKDWVAKLTVDQFPQFFMGGPMAYLFGTDIHFTVSSALVDATFALLFAIERLHAAGVPLPDCRGEKLRVELYKTKFQGATGLIQFDSVGDRAVSVDVWNVVNSSAAPGFVLEVVGGWREGSPMVLGGWEGNVFSPKFPLIKFVGKSSVPLPQLLQGCPKGQRYLGLAQGCVACAVGTFNPTDGNVENTCLPCEAGSHAATEGLSVCTVCPLGSFQNITGTSSCSLCGPGWYAGSVAQTTCEVCPRGTWSRNGSSACLDCDFGTYASTEASQKCTKCPSGFTTEFVGSRVGAACTCPVDTLFVPELPSGLASTWPADVARGFCFRCNQPGGNGQFSDGLSCLGGAECEALVNRTVVGSFPCPSLGSVCANPDGCASECIVPVAMARQVCESFDFRHVCEGWAVRSGALKHGDWLSSEDSGSGWQNVAILGRVSSSLATARSYGKPAAGLALVAKRSLCAPVPAGGATGDVQHPKHSIGSFQQAPLIKPGYYMPDLAAARIAGLPNSVDGRNDIVVPHRSLDVVAGTPRPWNASWFRLLPLDQGTTSEQPSVVPLFKCRSAVRCPGGRAGQCNPGHEGLNCAKCVSGFYSSPSGCSRCTGNDLGSVIVVLFAVVFVVVLVLLYHMTLNPITAHLTAKMTTGLAVGLTFNGLQSFGVISLMNIQFGEPLQGFLNSLGVFLFDIDQLQWECAMSVSPLGKIAARLLIPPMVCLAYAVLYLASKAAGRVSSITPWKADHTVNCTGMVLQVVFISICMAVILPFKCSVHPVGSLTTLVDIPHQVCGLGDHEAMGVLGVVFILCYPTLALVGCSYVIYVMPKKTAEDPTFLNAFKFLVSRFRYDRYYFGVLFMMRNLGIALVPVINPSNPSLQQVVMSGMLLAALLLQAILWPWAASQINYLDLGCLICMMMTVVLSGNMVNVTAENKDSAATIGAVFVILAFGLMAGVVFHGLLAAAGDVCHKRNRCMILASRIKTPTSNKGAADEMANATKHIVTVLGGWSAQSISSFIQALPVYDRRNFSQTLAMLLAVLDVNASCPSSSRVSTTGQRITVQRFKRRSSLQIADDAALAHSHVERSAESLQV